MRCIVATSFVLILALSASGAAQPQVSSAPSGGRTLVALNLAGARPGTLPPEIDLQTGALDIVDKNGRRMLRASSATAFLVNLPERLPKDFLLEFELIPKVTANSMDFSVEGTRNEDQGDESTNLMWFSSNVRAVGGGSHFDAPMPPSMYAALAGVPTQVAVSVQDRLIRVYTNGQLTQTIPNRKFVRNPFVRVFLGGENDEQEAVYVSSLRVSDMGSSTATAANASTAGSREPPGSQGSQQGGASGGAPGSGNRGSTNPSSTGSSSGAPVPNAITNLTVTDSPAGPVVNWLGVPGAVYTVERWLVADPRCCAASSPASPPLSSPPWQDSPLLVLGTYMYKVTSMTSSSSTSAEVQFEYTRLSSGQPIPDRTQPPERVTTAQTSPAPAPSVTSPNTGPIRSALTVTVTMGTSGPVVTWTLVPNATAYSVTRWKVDDPYCCNNTSGRSTGASTSWQDQPPSVSGAYVYRVSALSPLGEVYGETQFVYTAPSSSTPAQPVTALPVAPTSGTAILAAPPTSTTPPPGVPKDTSTAHTSSPVDNTGRYRVTLTGIRVTNTTLEPSAAPDGRGDEIYAAASVVVMDRTATQIRQRSSVKTREYGDITNGMFPGRIQAGTMSPNGGIWIGNGPEQVPSQFDPNGSAIPAPATDQFPLLVWEGILTDGGDAVLVVPSIWERDVDRTVYEIWSRNWSSSPLTALFGSVGIQLASPTLSAVRVGVTFGTPIVLPLAEMTASLRDHPIGVEPRPPMAPVSVVYDDRYVVITREKLTSLNTQGVGASMILPIDYREPDSVFSRGSYTLYLRIERVQ